MKKSLQTLRLRVGNSRKNFSLSLEKDTKYRTALQIGYWHRDGFSIIGVDRARLAFALSSGAVVPNKRLKRLLSRSTKTQ